MLTPKSPKTKSDFQSDNWEKREKTSWCSSVCVSEQNGPLPDVRNPFHLLCPCAPMAAGAVYTDCLTTQCTWRTTSRWRFEVVNSDSSPGRKLNNKQQVSWSTCGRTVRAFGGHPLTDLQLFLGQWLLRRRRQCTCARFAYLFSSSLDIQLIHLFIWRKGNTQADLHRHTSPFRSSSGQDSDCSGGLPLLPAQANKLSAGWMEPLGGLTDSVSG